VEKIEYLTKMHHRKGRGWKDKKTKTKRQKRRRNETTLIKKSSVAAENEL